MRKKNLFLISAIILVAIVAYAYSLPKLFRFDKKDALSEWQEKIFKNRVLYKVELRPDGGQLLAKSKNACSGLIYNIKFDPKKYPMISWKWRVVSFPEKSPLELQALAAKKPSLWDKLLDILRIKPLEPVKSKGSDKGTKSGWLERDDYAARIYVIFPSWIFSNIKSIEYIWSQDIPKGTIITSPYYSNIKLIVAESGKKDPNEWVLEERNIYEDYKKAFGKEPPYVGAIALMTDTDNTLSTAEALYTDIKVGYKND